MQKSREYTKYQFKPRAEKRFFTIDRICSAAKRGAHMTHFKGLGCITLVYSSVAKIEEELEQKTSQHHKAVEEQLQYIPG